MLPYPFKIKYIIYVSYHLILIYCKNTIFLNKETMYAMMDSIRYTVVQTVH